MLLYVDYYFGYMRAGLISNEKPIINYWLFLMNNSQIEMNNCGFFIELLTPAPVIVAETRCEALCRAARCSGKHGLQKNNVLHNFFEKLVLFWKGAQEIKIMLIVLETAFRRVSCKCLCF